MGINKRSIGCNCCGKIGCSICAKCVQCDGTPVSGATVTAKLGGSVVATCVTDSTGLCCLDLSSHGSGTYNISCSKAGYYGSNKNVVITCPSNTTIYLTLSLDAGAIKIYVTGCSTAGLGGTPQPLPNANVTVNNGDYTTDSSGYVYIPLANGTYTVGCTYFRYADYSGSFSIGGCNQTKIYGIQMVPATGYVCVCGCITPAKGTLNLFDPVIGSVPIVYGAGYITSGSNTYTTYYGQIDNYAFPGYCGCPAMASGNLSVRYYFEPIYCQLYVTVGQSYPYPTNTLSGGSCNFTIASFTVLTSGTLSEVCYPFSWSQPLSLCRCISSGALQGNCNGIGNQMMLWQDNTGSIQITE